MPAERSGWNFDSVISFLTAFATTVAIFAVITLGLNVQWGYTGVFNFGIAGFFMVGAYTAAVFTKSPAESEFVRYIGGFGDSLAFLPFLDSGQWLPFVFGSVAAALMAGALAFALSIPTLRLRADYLAISTIGIAELLRAVVLEERGLVNSARGLIGIPRPFHDFFEPDDYKFVYFGIAVLVLIVVFVAVERGIRSPWGRVLRALREDELTTAASGKNVFGFKMQGFIFGAMIMGIGGSIYAYERGSVSPDTFTPFFATFIFWVMLMVGGSGNNRGAILGAYIVWGIWTISLQLQGYDMPEFVRSRIFFVRDLLIGSLIVIVLLLRPAGLIPEERKVSLFIGRDTGPRPRGPTAEPQPPDEPPPD
ncbi:MAG: branched-chain amino acid ABC transporter permease [Dehalococcoidia bacterium]|nr:MAG: branched-chain amino acid ABC transporter permease [Dehalococcoidia bacterium]